MEERDGSLASPGKARVTDRQDTWPKILVGRPKTEVDIYEEER